MSTHMHIRMSVRMSTNMSKHMSIRRFVESQKGLRLSTPRETMRRTKGDGEQFMHMSAHMSVHMPAHRCVRV